MLDTRLLYGYDCFSDRHAGRSAADIRAAARDTGLSQADVVRQSLKAGLPKIRKQSRAGRKLKPFTKAESREAFGPDREWDSLEKAMALLPPRV